MRGIAASVTTAKGRTSQSFLRPSFDGYHATDNLFPQPKLSQQHNHEKSIHPVTLTVTWSAYTRTSQHACATSDSQIGFETVGVYYAWLDIHARGFWERKGSAFQMQSLIEASPQNQSTASIRVRREDTCKKANQAPLHHWYLVPPVHTRIIIIDCPNCYQPRREKITALQCHGFAPKSHSSSFVCAAMLDKLTLYMKSCTEHQRY